MIQTLLITNSLYSVIQLFLPSLFSNVIFVKFIAILVVSYALSCTGMASCNLYPLRVSKLIKCNLNHLFFIQSRIHNNQGVFCSHFRQFKFLTPVNIIILLSQNITASNQKYIYGMLDRGTYWIIVVKLLNFMILNSTFFLFSHDN